MRKGGGNNINKEGKCILESRIEFLDPILMTLDTRPDGPIKKFMKKWPKNARKMGGKIVFIQALCFLWAKAIKVDIL